MEEKVKKLAEEFSPLPKLLTKKTLCGDDVNGDLVKASQRLQEFTQINNPLPKSPMVVQSVADSSKAGKLQDSPAAVAWNCSEEQNWMNDTAFGRAPTFQNSMKNTPSDSFGNRSHKLGKVYGSATMSARSSETAKKIVNRTPGSPKSKSKPNWSREPGKKSDP